MIILESLSQLSLVDSDCTIDCENFKGGQKQVLEFIPDFFSPIIPLGKSEVCPLQGTGCEISRCSERCILVLHNEIRWVEMPFKGCFLPLNNKRCHQLFLISLWIMILPRQWASGYKCTFKPSNRCVIVSKTWPLAMAQSCSHGPWWNVGSRFISVGHAWVLSTHDMGYGCNIFVAERKRSNS